MERFYKITKEQSNLIGRFDYDPNKQIDPYVGEQKDGTYLVSEFMYELLKDRTEINKVDFTKCEKITKEQIDIKETPLTAPK